MPVLEPPVAAPSREGARKPSRSRKGLVWPRVFTREGTHPYDEIRWVRNDVSIANDRGEILFVQRDVEHPDFWSSTAVKIAASKYFYGDAKIPGARESSIRDLIDRVVKTLRSWGESHDMLFASAKDAQAFEEELTWLLVHQYGAFNSPVWFNCGLWHHRHINEGEASGYYYDRKAGKAQRSPGPYHYPQCSACFILDIQDDMESILDHAMKEGRLFKFGSGTGTNYSSLRSSREKVSGGGRASGPLSFMRIFDSVAGAVKSGGKTRRAAKMDILNVTHPDIREFIWAKKTQEDIGRVLTREHGYSSSMDGLIYHDTLRFQNSNQSVRVTRDFMEAVLSDGEFWTKYVRSGEPCEKHSARRLMREMAESAWDNAEPGIQYDDHSNDWHTCPNSGRINASNPCSEYFFLDNTACNLASLRLTKFLDAQDRFDMERYRAAVRVFFLAQEIIVDHASYPTALISEMSHRFRTIGLGYADAGALLMALALPYDSEAGRQFIGALTGIMTGEAYLMSSRIAAVAGPFEGYAENREPMLRVMRKHAGLARDLVAEIRRTNPELEPYAAESARVWDACCASGEKHGYRNAQATVIAPTGTISFLMDCDTTGIEPDFALVKLKSCAGGGHLKIVNQMVPRALKKLGYSDAEAKDVFTWMAGTTTLRSDCPINRASLKAKGLTDEELDRIEKAVANTASLVLVTNAATLGEETLQRLGCKSEQYQAKSFNLLKELGFTHGDIAASDAVICGRFCIEGAPHIKTEHFNVFNCANVCGDGAQFIRPMAHLEMMGYAQRWISGSISKTVNLPRRATVEEIEQIYIQAWKFGVKSVAVYRDGSKGVAPLSSGGAKKEGKTSGLAEQLKQALAHVGQLEKKLATRDLEMEQLRKASAAQAAAVRRRPPLRRLGETHKFTIGGAHKGYLTINLYEDGSPCEVFLTMNKEGSFASGMADVFAKFLSLAIQHGIPIKEIAESFKFTRFEPSGFVDNPRLRSCESVVDYVVRYLELVEADKDQGRLDFNRPAVGEVPKAEAPPNGSGHGHTPAYELSPAAPARQMEVSVGVSNGKYSECPACGSSALRQTGACMACQDCGWSAGCG
ncbi:MAG: adenosylcobalamin-dependent ribonucleoside-diphosphate reductase [Verrucomicrobiae bacterium]|nr:adenosylcobalamin-dependent ribonucleoside-diphosphate reductase [Verrucomicrobiae bacterium]